MRHIKFLILLLIGILFMNNVFANITLSQNINIKFNINEDLLYVKNNNTNNTNNTNITNINKSFSKNETIYDRPYSFTDNNVNFERVKKNVYLVLGASLIGVGILYLMPESITNWDKDDLKDGDLFKKWGDNVREGPVTDSDDWFLNYVTHPYWGAVYYMAARSSGANAVYSFIFSTLASTLFWEYGVEAFAEVPSKQDLIITPVIGSIIGEGFYLAKRNILSNNYELLGSTIFGHVVIFLMDPITEFFNLFDSDKKEKNKNIHVASFPTFDMRGNYGYNIMLNINF